MNGPYDAFEVFEYGDRNYAVTLVSTVTGARFRHGAVVCGRQAHYAATRCGTRPMRFLGVSTMRQGEVVATVFPAECTITDPLHVHVHRMAMPEVQR